MRSSILSCLAILTIASLGRSGSLGAADDCVVLDLPEVPAAHAAELRRSSSPTSGWWVELGEELLVCGDLVAEVRGDCVLRRIEGIDPGRLAVARRIPREALEIEGHRVLAKAHGLAIVEATADWTPGTPVPEGAEPGCRPPRLDPIDPGSVVLRRTDLAPEKRRATTFTAGTAAVVAAVDPARWFADVVTLAGWDRYTRRTEILQARDWVAAQLAGLGLTVTTPSFPVGTSTGYNVIGVAPGATRPHDWVLIGGHYDSTAPSYPAPGADDNASGCAGVLELARVLTPTVHEATLVFICFSGEEQGLYGSTAHASGLVASGDDDKVVALINMDMIGYDGDSVLDVQLESEHPEGDVIVPLLADAAAAFAGPVTYTTWFAWGSDHEPYLDRGMPAVLTIEDEYDDYPDYHQSTDLPGNLSQALGGAILRMNAGAAAHLAGAGGGSIFADDFESGTLTAWTSSLGGR